MKNIEEYTDIINRARPVSKKHSPMPVSQRAAQFSPFAALTGFDEEIVKTSEEEIRMMEKIMSYDTEE